MSAFRLPLTNTPQLMSLALAGVVYQVRSRFNQFAGVWFIDLYTSNGVPVLLGVPLVAGVNLLRQFDYLDLGGRLIAQTTHAVDTPPTYENLGVNGNAFFITP